MKEIPEAKLVWVDETGISDNEAPVYAWAYSGVRAPGKCRGRAHRRVSIAASLQAGNLTSALVLEGGFITEAFIGFIDKCLVPSLQPGSVVILDNARIHQSSLIRKSLNDAGCELMFQPKYSPDLNPIEHCWSPLKAEIRKGMEANLEQAPKLYEKATEILRLRLT